MRIILFTGKGGVGKTTLSAATALLAAKKGKKTLIISTDAAHSLSDIFSKPLTNHPRQILPNLYAQEVDALEQLEKKWGEIQSYLKAFLASQGIDSIEAEELSIFPGMEELFSLMEIRHYDRQKEYEVIIVDCAPTGDTLRFLSAPEITQWYLRHIFPLQRTAAKAVRPVANRLLPFPFPEDSLFEAIKNLTSQLAEMKTILADLTKTSIRLVVNPEKMVIKEAQRAFTFFYLFGYNVDAILVNRLLPPNIKDDYFQFWKIKQQENLSLIEECFSPLPILNVELFDQEIIGLDLIEDVAQKLYQEKDPTEIFFVQAPLKIDKINHGFELSLDLPFVDKESLSLSQNGEELTIRVGKFKRNLILPNFLARYNLQEARFEQNKLKITFTPP
ncbi:MAG: arsenic-transporting ATPase [Candidatus Aminicenantes bacterium 4484_214]|nr:MAG: arsenic-transporting ATPase [Candidatus Aminicenantes bacterium 4484_214]